MCADLPHRRCAQADLVVGPGSMPVDRREEQWTTDGRRRNRPDQHLVDGKLPSAGVLGDPCDGSIV
ncbi:MAG: hypothetical protein ABSG81_05670, partial [Acidimicrobiales bacterium]